MKFPLFTSTTYDNAFQPFSSRGTFETLLNFWRNLDTKNSTNMRIFAEPCKELAEPVGSAEPRLKNTGIDNNLSHSLIRSQNEVIQTERVNLFENSCTCSFNPLLL